MAAEGEQKPSPPVASSAIADRYDRQLRLWGAREQQSLSEAHLVVLGATGPAVAALKNLILLGIKAITLVDNQRVRREHLTENFFLLPSDCEAVHTAVSTVPLPPYLSERTAFSLSELNKDCSCYYAAEDPEVWVQRFTSIFDPAFATSTAEAQNDGRCDALRRLLQSAVLVSPPSSSPSREAAAPLMYVSGIVLTDRVTDTHSLTSPFLRTVFNFVRTPFYLFLDGDSTQPPRTDAALKEHILKVLQCKEPLHQTDKDSTCATVTSPTPPRCFSVYDCFAPFAQLPVFALSSCGMLASLQVLNEDTVIYNTTQSVSIPTADLRFFFPFPELEQFFLHINPDDDAQFDSTDADKVMLHSHIPYTCLLYFALRKVMRAQPELFTKFVVTEGEATAAGDITQKNVELSADVIKAMRVELNRMRRREQPAQETFEEGIGKLNALLNQPAAAARKVYRELCAIFATTGEDEGQLSNNNTNENHNNHNKRNSKLPSELAFAPLTKLYAQQQQRTRPAAPSQAARLLYLLYKPREVLLYYILHSIKVFYEKSYAHSCIAFPPGLNGEATGTTIGTHVLPFNGHVPDITTLTHWYTTMQTLYKRKHEADVETVAATAAQDLWRDVLPEDAAATSLRFTEDERHQLRQHIHGALYHLTKEVVRSVFSLKRISYDCNEAAEALYRVVPSCASTAAGSGASPSLTSTAAYTLEVHSSAWRHHLQARAAHLWTQWRDAYENARSNAADDDDTGTPPTCLHIEMQSHALALAYLALQERRRWYAQTHQTRTESLMVELKQLLEGAQAPTEDDEESEAARQAREAAGAQYLSTAVQEVEQQSGFMLSHRSRSSSSEEDTDTVYVPAIPSIAACIGAITTQEVLKALFYKEIPETKQIVFNGYGNCLVKVEKC